MNHSATARDVAAWMLAEFERQGVLHQDEAAFKIAEHFGREFTYDNANGNQAIAKSVLDEFRRLSGKDVVWSRSDRYWRRREDGDLPGRQQP